MSEADDVIRIREAVYGQVATIASVSVAALIMMTSIRDFLGLPTTSVIMLAMAGVAVWSLRSPALTVADDHVHNRSRLRNRRIPITGLDDLMLSDGFLYRASDRHKIANLGPSFVNQADVAALRRAIESAREAVA